MIVAQDWSVYSTHTVRPDSPYATGDAKYVFGAEWGSMQPGQPFSGRGKLLGKVVRVLEHRDGHHKVIMIEIPRKAGGPPIPPRPDIPGLTMPWD